MKEEVIELVKILGVSYTELLIDIELSEFTINSIESIEDDIIVHIFVQEMDLQILFDDLIEIDQKKILRELSVLAYN